MAIMASFVYKSSPAKAIRPIESLKLIKRLPLDTLYILLAALSEMYSLVSSIILPSLLLISAIETHLLCVSFFSSHDDLSPRGGVLPIFIGNTSLKSIYSHLSFGLRLSFNSILNCLCTSSNFLSSEATISAKLRLSFSFTLLGLFTLRSQTSSRVLTSIVHECSLSAFVFCKFRNSSISASVSGFFLVKCLST